MVCINYQNIIKLVASYMQAVKFRGRDDLRAIGKQMPSAHLVGILHVQCSYNVSSNTVSMHTFLKFLFECVIATSIATTWSILVLSCMGDQPAQFTLRSLYSVKNYNETKILLTYKR